MKITTSMRKNINMFSVIQDSSYISFQIIVKQKAGSNFTKVSQFVSESSGELVFVHREYDGSERYRVLLPSFHTTHIDVFTNFIKHVDSINNSEGCQKGGIIL